MKPVSIADAKNTLPELVHQAEAGQPLQLTRRGQPVAVLLSDVEYQRLRAAATTTLDFARWAQNWRAQLPAGFDGIRTEELERWGRI